MRINESHRFHFFFFFSFSHNEITVEWATNCKRLISFSKKKKKKNVRDKYQSSLIICLTNEHDSKALIVVFSFPRTLPLGFSAIIYYNINILNKYEKNHVKIAPYQNW